MERDTIYLALMQTVSRYRMSVDQHLIHDNELDVLRTVSALTDAVYHEIICAARATRMLEVQIEGYRTPTEAPDTGKIAF